mmetsp:Transcript_33933/g.79907  ORF Transcript_33933/g.79907 Transcript_33933/m.79907 type:complete len:250 (-) Transcript_33933:1182-1931(-)
MDAFKIQYCSTITSPRSYRCFVTSRSFSFSLTFMATFRSTRSRTRRLARCRSLAPDSIASSESFTLSSKNLTRASASIKRSVRHMLFRSDVSIVFMTVTSTGRGRFLALRLSRALKGLPVRQLPRSTASVASHDKLRPSRPLGAKLMLPSRDRNIDSPPGWFPPPRIVSGPLTRLQFFVENTEHFPLESSSLHASLETGVSKDSVSSVDRSQDLGVGWRLGLLSRSPRTSIVPSCDEFTESSGSYASPL